MNRKNNKNGKWKVKRGDYNKPHIESDLRSELRVEPLYDFPESRDQKLMQSSLKKSQWAQLNQVYHFKQTVDITQVNQVAISPSFGAYYFNLNSVDNLAPFQTLFDQYRLELVIVKFMPIFTESIPVAGTVMPRLYTAIDVDDATAPTTLAEVRQYQSCQETSPCRGVARVLQPKFSLAAYQGAFSGYAQGAPKQWLDIASPSIEWYGIKFAIEAGLTGQTILQGYKITVDQYWSFKNTR